MAQTYRDQGLDCTKGIAILAVVLFHVTRGFTSSGQLIETVGLRFADTFAYGFHVPVFFLIAGYLAFPKADDAHYQLRRQSSFYYTYILWSLISWALSAAFSHSVNSPMGLQSLIWLPVIPIQHFWFILVMMAGTALLGLLRTSMQLLIATALLVATGFGWSNGAGFWANPNTAIYVHSLPFILLGGWIRHSGVRIPISLIGTLVALAAFSFAVWSVTMQRGSLSTATALPIILAGCYLAYSVGTYAARIDWLGSALTTLGQHSYSIYILHVIAGAGVRILLGKFMPGLHVGLALFISFAVALLVPIILERIARQLGLSVLAGFDPLPFRNGVRREAPAA